MKISTKISLSFFSIFILTLLLIMTIFCAYLYNNAKSNIFSYLFSSSRARAEHVRTYILEQKETNKILAAAGIYRDFLLESSTSAQYKVIKEKVQKRLARTLLVDVHISRVSVLNNKGIVLASSNPTFENINQGSEDFFIRGKSDVYIQDVYLSPDNKTYYRIAAPIINEDGSVLGVSIIEYRTTEFFLITDNENGFGNSEESFIINKDRYLLTPSRFLKNTDILKTQINTKNAKLCFDAKEIDYINKNGYVGLKNHLGENALIRSKDYRNVDVVATHLYIPETNWCLITKVDQSELFKTINNLLYILTLVIFGSICFVFLITIKISHMVIRPIKSLQKSAGEIEKGNLEYPIDTSSNDEIGQLARSIKSLTKTLIDSKSNTELKIKEQTGKIAEQKKSLEEQKTALLNVLEDVELEKKNSEQNAHDLQKFRLAVEHASDHIVITDPVGIILYANHAVEQITGFNLSEIVGKKAGAKTLWGGLMNTAFYETLWKAIKTEKKVFSGEIKNKRKNGEQYFAEVHVSPVLNKQNEVLFFVGIERDITKAKEIDRMKTEFISLASHQLRTPLSAMKWFLEMLLHGDAGNLTKEQTEFVDNINQSNDRMIELVNSLLNVSRIESGRIIIDPKPTDISKLIHNVVDELSIKLKAKKLSLIIDIHKSIPLVSVDEKLIRQIYINLLTNAIKYSNEGGELLIVVSKDSKEIISQITDYGFGIPQNEQSKIFDKFFRATNAVKKVTDGNGLGLYLVKSIVESSGGKIWFTSKENIGSSFFFSIPLVGSKQKKGEVTIS